jgi:hypothetical protein
MNDLSWLIYLAEVSGSLSSLTQGISIIGFFSVVISLLAGFMWMAEKNGYIHHERDKVSFPKVVVDYIKIVLPLTIIFSFVSTFTPSRNTVMLIAASEMSQTVIETPQAQRVFNTLEQMLNNFVETTKSK